MSSGDVPVAFCLANPLLLFERTMCAHPTRQSLDLAGWLAVLYREGDLRNSTVFQGFRNDITYLRLPDKGAHFLLFLTSPLTDGRPTGGIFPRVPSFWQTYILLGLQWSSPIASACLNLIFLH
jgi:hypothetical protein